MGWVGAALWGLAGAGINRALVFLEANRRVKGPAWRYPEGPGGGFFALAVVLHCAIAAAVTAAAAQSGYVTNAVVALGLGVSAPVAIKTMSRVALSVLTALADSGHDGKEGGNS
jgi:hypothetical protein